MLSHTLVPPPRSSVHADTDSVLLDAHHSPASAHESPPNPPEPPTDEPPPTAEPQDLEDLEFLLDEIEDQIAPLA